MITRSRLSTARIRSLIGAAYAFMTGALIGSMFVIICLRTSPPSIIASQTDLYLRRLWGKPHEDLAFKHKYLLTLTVGVAHKDLVNKAVSKFDKREWMIVLFHYDGKMDGWNEYEWSRRAIHIGAEKQTKWWYAKRFLHPDVVEPFEYIFLWDEDLDLQHFDPQRYIHLANKHKLQVSQPAVENGSHWRMTKRRKHVEVHNREAAEPGWCEYGSEKPPCAAFVEIMAPVFSKAAWRCVWNIVQNDLVHGWGLDFGFQRCARKENIGVVNAQWLKHIGVRTLGTNEQLVNGRPLRKLIDERCVLEWRLFLKRMKKRRWFLPSVN